MGPPSVGFTTRKVAAVQFQKAEKGRLKREDCHRVKHDKLFSDWKILVGSSDWRSHAADEEGSQRYRLHNLPATYFGPGVYELGLTLQNLSAPREARPRKLRKQDVVVVYLGQAENVRQRLKKYGQSGSHLEGARLVPGSIVEDCEYDDQRTSPSPHKTRAKADGSTGGSTERGLRLFTEVFSRGYSIVFRWARTESKQMAENVESELLHVFDYPWNRGLNGARRPDDILARLELMQYHLEQSLCLGRFLGAGREKWKLFHRKVGIKVPVKRPSEEGSSGGSRFSIFRASSKDGLPDASSNSADTLCGVLLANGSKCSKSPVKGRRRCSEHKGLRAKLTTRRARTAKSKTGECGSNPSNPSESYSGHKGNPPVLVVKSTPNGKRLELSDAPSDGLVCGVTLDGGSACLNESVKDRKRCAAHKGMRTGRKSTGSPITIHRSLHTPAREANHIVRKN
ncbi:hypothetical protein Mapa_014573 [Marchantia paleacea]|nr:hypothetical protein Mapa_014573 [Marchantia paleacea]